MSILLGCIADDFTGASDLAAIPSRSGVPVNLRLGVPDADGAVAPFEIVTLKCRTAPREEAVRDALAGSCSKTTRRQVAAFAERAPLFRLDPIGLARGNQLEEAPAWLAACEATETPLIAAGAEPDQVLASQEALGWGRAGELVERALGTLAAAAADAGRRGIVVAGGESAGAVCRALGVTRLAIGREIAPGVPWTHTRRDGHDLALALKSGNFGGSDFFAEALVALGAPPAVPARV